MLCVVSQPLPTNDLLGNSVHVALRYTSVPWLTQTFALTVQIKLRLLRYHPPALTGERNVKPPTGRGFVIAYTLPLGNFRLGCSDRERKLVCQIERLT
eukprot:398620-Amphidinium_carterae.1